MSYNVKCTTLDNGMMVATDQMRDTYSAVLYLAVRVGSRAESSENNGVSHFLEHMAFKGTEKRTAKAIFDEINSIGGYMNAGTGQESTGYYIKVLKEDIEVAMDVLSDILQNSIFNAEELERERGVILQELSSSLDSPDDMIMTHFAEASYGSNTPLGRTILGTKETISAIKREDCMDYMSLHYHADNMVLGFSGDIDHERIVELAQKYFNKIKKKPKQKILPSKYIGGTKIVQQNNLNQVQFMVGFKTFPYMDIENSAKMSVIVRLLGGTVSSRLYQEIRENRGLVYTVEAFDDLSEDEGMMCIYAGTSEDKLLELNEVIASVLKGAMLDISQDEISKVIKQIKSSSLMQRESTHHRASKVASDFLIHGRYIYPAEALSLLSNFSAQEAKNLLGNVLKSEHKISLAVYGNVANFHDYLQDYKF